MLLPPPRPSSTVVSVACVMSWQLYVRRFAAVSSAAIRRLETSRDVTELIPLRPPLSYFLSVSLCEMRCRSSKKKGRLEGRSCGPRKSAVMAMTRHLPPSNPQPPLMSSLHHVGCGYKASCTGSSSSGTPAKWAWLRAVHKQQQQQQRCYLLSVTTSCQNSPTDTLVIFPNSISSFHFKCTDIFLNSMVVKVSLSVVFLYEKKNQKVNNKKIFWEHWWYLAQAIPNIRFHAFEKINRTEGAGLLHFNMNSQDVDSKKC